MSYRFVKRQNAIGWDWYLELDGCSSWVSQLAKWVIESLESENAKLREVVEAILQCAGETKRDKGCDACPMYDESAEVLVRDSWCHLFSALRELGIKVDGQGRQAGSGDRPMTAEFDGLIKDAPRFHVMGNSELIAYAYGMFAAGKKIESENAKLCEELADVPKCEACEAMLDCDECLRADGSHKERRRLSAENEKLRELCKKLYRLADESYVPFKDVNPWMNEFDNAIRAMRELGIEADE